MHHSICPTPRHYNFKGAKAKDSIHTNMVGNTPLRKDELPLLEYETLGPRREKLMNRHLLSCHSLFQFGQRCLTLLRGERKPGHYPPLVAKS